MPDPIRIRSGSAGKHWPEAGRMIPAHWLASGPDPFGLLPDRIRLAKTWHSQPELHRIRAGFAQYYPGRLWKKGTESESGKLVAGRLRPARTGPDDSCTPASFQTRCVWPNPDQAIQIRSGSVLRNMIHAFFGKTELKRMREVGSGIYDPGRFWLHAGRNDHNWQPKRFRIGSSMFTGTTIVSDINTTSSATPSMNNSKASFHRV